MKRYLLIGLFVILSCNKAKEKIEDYTEDELYEVQGIITKITPTSSPFDDSNIKIMNYIYHLDYESPLEGIDKNYDLVYTEGAPIIVLVSKKNPKISFFSRFGRIDDRLVPDDEIEEHDTIPRDGVKIFKIENDGSN